MFMNSTLNLRKWFVQLFVASAARCQQSAVRCGIFVELRPNPISSSVRSGIFGKSFHAGLR
jgi:hypothetical protein